MLGRNEEKLAGDNTRKGSKHKSSFVILEESGRRSLADHFR
jgi:hypothetical protein